MNWFPLSIGKSVIVAAMFLLFSWLAVSNQSYRKELQLTQQKLSFSDLENNKQAVLIKTLQNQEAQNRVLMAEQQQQELQLRQQSEQNQRKYLHAIKNDECAAQRVSDDVIEFLRRTNPTDAGANSAFAP